ncbi:MAG: site-specific integrase, partial [Nitrososphaeraceae archaeon]
MKVSASSITLREEKIYSNFIDSLPAEKTRISYKYELKRFMDFIGISSYTELLEIVSRSDTTEIEEKIKSYILDMVNRNFSTSYMKVFIASVSHFYEWNDIENIRWRKLKRFMGEKTPEHEDRCYTHEEIQTLLNNSDLKLKVIILLMASAGLRLGTLPTLLVKHLEKIDSVYKINVYKGLKGKGKYYTFCTPECVTAIDSYLKFRERSGEKITGDSPLLRKDFDSLFHETARKNVIPATYASIRMVVFSTLVKSGLRTIDHTNFRNRKEVKMTHGFRKFFETMLVNSNIHETIIRKLTGHSDKSNLTQLYSRQTAEEMLSEYSRAIDPLTIDPTKRMA